MISAVALSCCLLCGTSYTEVTYGQQPARSQSAYQRPLAPEKNPPGDIPDNQVFIDYRSPLGFSIKVPEGWARREQADGAVFSDKYNTIALARSKHSEPLTLSGLKANELPRLRETGKAVSISDIKVARLPSGNAVVVSYASNSEPNPVTNKAIRLENARYYLWKNGELVTLTLSAPYGADNADQWQLMAMSFRWL